MKKPGKTISFTKEVKALKSEDASEKLYMELGSKHKVKRFEISIEKVEEVKKEGAG